jgi:hypothetical protein
LSFSFVDDRVNEYQNKLKFDIPYSSKTFTDTFNLGLKKTCKEYIIYAQVHHIFENYVITALEDLRESARCDIGGGRGTFYVSKGVAVSSDYNVDSIKRTGAAEVVYSVVYTVYGLWAQIDLGDFEFTVK